MAWDIVYYTAPDVSVPATVDGRARCVSGQPWSYCGLHEAGHYATAAMVSSRQAYSRATLSGAAGRGSARVTVTETRAPARAIAKTA